MNNIDYQKAYEDALERAKRLGTLECPIDPLRTIGEQIFPELENNVNERMIECIRLALTHVSEEIFAKFGTNLRDVLFWLEKQKVNPYSGVRFNYNGHTWTLYKTGRFFLPEREIDRSDN